MGRLAPRQRRPIVLLLPNIDAMPPKKISTPRLSPTEVRVNRPWMMPCQIEVVEVSAMKAAPIAVTVVTKSTKSRRTRGHSALLSVVVAEVIETRPGCFSSATSRVREWSWCWGTARPHNTGLSGKAPSVRSRGTLSVPMRCSTVLARMLAYDLPGFGMPRSLQMFAAVGPTISLWRGTADVLRFAGFQ